jgi:hypothetical protein
MAETLSADALSVLWTSRARRSARIESHAAEILALFNATPDWPDRDRRASVQSPRER